MPTPACLSVSVTVVLLGWETGQEDHESGRGTVQDESGRGTVQDESGRGTVQDDWDGNSAGRA